MWFSIHATDCENSSAKRAVARPEHIERLSLLMESGRLMIAGPNPSPTNDGEMLGSIIIAQFDSFEEAKQWANADPYLAAGVYTKVDVRPFKPVIGSAI